MTSNTNSQMKSALEEFERKGLALKGEAQQLRVKAALAKMEVRDATREALDRWQKSYEDWRMELREAQESSQETWENLSQRLAAGWGELESGFKRARREMQQDGPADA